MGTSSSLPGYGERYLHHMNLNVLIPNFIGALLLAIGVHNELQWRQRLRGHASIIGRVTHLHPDEDGDCYPEIEYSFGGETRRFRSNYSIGPTPFIGETVKVIVDSRGENAEYFTNKTRWYYTTIPIVAGVAALAIGLL